MSRVINIISKTKTQYEEYGKIKNQKFDNKIAKIELERAKFDKWLDQKIKCAKD